MIYLFLFDEDNYGSLYGIGTYIKQLIKSLIGQKNLKLHLIKFTSNVSEFTILEEDYISLLIPKNNYFNIDNSNYYRDCWILIYKYITSIHLSYDIIFHFNYKTTLSLLETIKKDFPHSKFLYTFHFLDEYLINSYNPFSNKEKLHLIPNEEFQISLRKDKRIYKELDKIICLSNSTHKLLNKVFNIGCEKISFIPNGMFDNYVSLSSSRIVEMRKNFYFKKKDKIILFVGRIVEIKNIEIIIKSFRELIKEEPNSHLIIVGDGGLSYILKECSDIWRKITFTGYIGQQNLFKLYQIADVGIILSKHEQCSYVAIEMMMFNLPIIYADSIGLNEMFLNQTLRVCNKLIDNKLSISAVECKNLILKALALKKRTNTRDIYLERYELKYMKDKYYNLIQTLSIRLCK